MQNDQGTMHQYRSSQTIQDLDRALLPFLVVLASAVIYLCIFKDVARVGVRWDWIAIRLGYLPFSLAVIGFARRLRGWNGRLLEAAVWLTGSYIIWFCTHFSRETGLFESHYVFGIWQFFIGIALMPVSGLTYFGFTILSSLYHFFVLHQSAGFATGGFAPALSNHVSFMMFGGVVYFIVSRIRNQRYRLEWQLLENLASQDRVISEQTRTLARARTEEALVSAMRMLAHDIRKPFRLLEQALEGLAQVSGAPAADSRGVLDTLRQRVREAIAQTNAMLAEASAKPASLPADDQPFPLGQALDAALAQVGYPWTAGQHPELKRCEAHSQLASGDQVRLTRVFANILDNAVYAAGPHGRVWIATATECTADGLRNVVVIGNDGPAIPLQHQHRIFEDFFTSGKRSGTGLGLGIARKFVTAMGGTLTFTSDRHRTEFRVVLPAAPGLDGHLIPKAGEAAAAAVAAAGMAGCGLHDLQEARIAVVDDDVFVRESWEKAAGDYRSVATFATPEEFLERLASDPGLLSRLDLVISDYYFAPESLTTGTDILAEVRRRSPIQVWLASDADLPPAEAGGFAARISKGPILPTGWCRHPVSVAEDSLASAPWTHGTIHGDKAVTD